jgi:hypothetical protein
VLKTIQDTIAATRIDITESEALLVAPKLFDFYKLKGRLPELRSDDPHERRMAEVGLWLTKRKAQLERDKQNSNETGELFS